MIEFDKSIPEALQGKIMWACMEEGIDNVCVTISPLGNDDWDWVKTDYCPLFKTLGKEPHYRECVKRMKALFKMEKNNLTQELVIAATKLYLSENRDPKYIKQPHYFIFKGSGAERTDDLLGYIDRIKNQQPQQRDITEQIQ